MLDCGMHMGYNDDVSQTRWHPTDIIKSFYLGFGFINNLQRKNMYALMEGENVDM